MSIVNVVGCVLCTFIAVWMILILLVLTPEPDEAFDVGAQTFQDSVVSKPMNEGNVRGSHAAHFNNHSYGEKSRSFISKASSKPAKQQPTMSSPDALPLSSEWLFIRSVRNYGQNGQQAAVGNNENFPSKSAASKAIEPIKLNVREKKPANELKWPPVPLDGTLSTSDGIDIMPMIDIKVPRFWQPKAGDDFNKVGSKVGGEETIFLMIASYRDFQCRETITSAFARADHPERLFIGAVDQTVPGDIGCLDLEVPCSQDPSQPMCVHRDQISVYHMDAQYATGPVTARHIGDRMYRGEYYVMQMDAHCQFVRHWDTKIIDQWKSTRNEMAVLR
jgi:hypothetical protein